MQKQDKEALEELADLLEVIHALAKTHGASFNEVEEIRAKRQQNAVAFKREFSS